MRNRAPLALMEQVVMLLVFALAAAETGHLLIATLHTRGAVNTIDRIIDSFPGGQQEQVRAQLSMVLRTVVSQQLLPGKKGRLVPAFEVMRMNSAVRGLIRDNKTHQIDNAIAAGGSEGMMTMDQSILSLYEAGEITAETALSFAGNVEQMRRRIGQSAIWDETRPAPWGRTFFLSSARRPGEWASRQWGTPSPFIERKL